MFILGHLGFGSWLAKPFIGADIDVEKKKRFLKPGLPLKWVLWGCILPDLIDKPLYYGLSWATGKQGAELGLISGTRTFGHTALFALAITIAAYFRHSKILAALSIGIATHLLLDSLGGLFQPVPSFIQISPLLWPFTSTQFPVYPYIGIAQHLTPTPYIMVTESVGALLLLLTYIRYGKRRKFFTKKKTA